MTCNLIPIDLTDEQKGRICGVISVGCDWQTAANFVGCLLSDIRRTMQQDPQFAAGLHRAEAATELSHMRTIQQAAKETKNWRASVWWLERHSPERFGRRGAGVVTPRQIKAFMAILADTMREVVTNGDDRKQIMARLKTLAESVDQMLRDDSMSEISSVSDGESLDSIAEDWDNFSDDTSL
jgi:truncated hemoglobin YjbI